MTAIRCKVCANETVRSQVDRMISEGVSDDGVSRALASVGVEISKASILRHRTNHLPSVPPDGVDLPPDMVVPRPSRVDTPPPLGDAPAQLLEEVRQTVANGGAEVDITLNRLVRETLLSRIYESQLAITASALDRFQTGEGRYPLDMVRGLQAVSLMFEKTALQTTANQASVNTLFEREIERRENLVYQDAYKRVLKGERLSENIPAHYCQVNDGYGVKAFRFGNGSLNGHEYNQRMSRAWKLGIDDAKEQKRIVANV